jgi:hypothetical protein
MILLTTTRENGSDVFRRGPRSGWVVVDRPPAFPAPKPAAAELRDVATAAGRLVAIGQDGKRRPLLLLSRDGRRWARLPFQDAQAQLFSVTVTAREIMIAGTRTIRAEPHLALWTSRDGKRWEQVGGTRGDPIGAFVDVVSDRGRSLALAYEGSARGLVTSVWSGRGALWRTDAVLGRGEARALCMGPHGATAVSVRDGQSADEVVVWQRGATGRWPREPELVATNARPHGCADAGFGTFVVGSDRASASVMWTRRAPGERWTPNILQTSNPAGSLYDITRDGDSVLVTGAGGSRGQLDLVLWRFERGRGNALGGGDPVFSAPGGQGGFGVVGYRNQIVIVGRSGAGDGAIWLGRDPVPGIELPGGTPSG